MNDTSQETGPTRSRYSLVARLFMTCCVLIVAFAVVGYAAGWVTFQHDQQQQKSTIEVETGQVKQAAEEAVEKGKELIDQAGDQIQELTDRDDGAKSNPPADIEDVPTNDIPDDNTDHDTGEASES